MSLKNNIKISAIIVNYNGGEFLKKTVDALLKQTYDNIEIIIVDNDSKDNSISTVENLNVNIIKSTKNLGFAGGNNLGISNSTGDYLLFINPDTLPDTKMVEILYKELIENKYDVIGPQINNNSQTFTIDVLGYPIKNSEKLFYLSGACFLVSKKLYTETGGLDEDFFLYFEETDWFWRLQIFGKKVGVSKVAQCYHVGGVSVGGYGLKYRNYKWKSENNLQMVLKNYSFVSLIFVIPLYIANSLLEVVVFTFMLRFDIVKAILEGYSFNLKIANKIISKRKFIQKNRKISDVNLFKKMYFGYAKFKTFLDITVKKNK